MSLWRGHRVLAILSLAMGVHFLNISIDPPDAQPFWIAEDLSVNETETIIEMVLENVLDFVDCIPEHEDHNERHVTHGLIHISHNYVSQPLVVITSTTVLTKLHYFIKDDSQVYLCPDHLRTPPPKV